MSSKETETEESDWTKANLQKLLTAMKTNIPEQDRMYIYTKGLKDMDWNKVAFPPFSPQVCQQKWGEILQKMRKMRTLTELINEAEDVISNPLHNKRIHPEIPKKPSPPNAIFFEENRAKFQKQHPKMTSKNLFRLLNEKFKALPDKEKARYVTKHKLASEEYSRKMLEFRKQYEIPPKRKCLTKGKMMSADTPDGKQPEDEDGPPSKPSVNGYHLFCKEQSASMAGVSKKDFVKEWAQRWRGLTEKQRQEYSRRCTELKNQHSFKLNKYLTTLDEEEQQRILDKHRIKRSTVTKIEGEPKMPSRSGNSIFIKDQMELLKGEFPDSKQRFTKVTQIWRDLPNKEKERHRHKVYERFEKYSMELQKWFETLGPEEQEHYLTHNPRKRKYLHTKKVKLHETEEIIYVPSDSEDEDIEDSSSGEEEGGSDCVEVEEEEEDEGDNMFYIY